MATKKFKNGIFCFYRARSVTPITPEAARQLAEQHQIPPEVVPAYAGDRAIVPRARGAVMSALSRQGWLVHPITQTRTYVCYGIVQESKDQAQERLDHTFDDVARWSAEPGPDTPDGPQRIHGTHEIAQRIDQEYQRLRGTLAPADWTAKIAEFLTGPCQAAAMREDGRIYWCPPPHMDVLRRFAGLLEHVGISLLLCEVEAEAKDTVKEAAHESLYTRLEQIEQKVIELANPEIWHRPETYKRRLAELSEVRATCIAYHEAFEGGGEWMLKLAASLEQTVKMAMNPDDATPGTPAAIDYDQHW
jgi:hypothetical protein